MHIALTGTPSSKHAPHLSFFTLVFISDHGVIECGISFFSVLVRCVGSVPFHPASFCQGSTRSSKNLGSM